MQITYPIPKDFSAAAMRAALRRMVDIGTTEEAFNEVLTAIVAIAIQNSIKG